jgi:predicted phosphodiesterase
VVVVGDFGTGSGNEREVAAAMHDAATVEGANWFLTTGDNLYGDDIDIRWSIPFAWVGQSGMQIVAALGNHDVENDERRSLAMSALRIPSEWYRTQIGEAVVLVLNANRVDDDVQLDWLRANLERSDDELVVVVFHHAALSCSNHGSSPQVIERWMPLFEEHDVDLVLNGHEHNYQRHERSGVTYVVTGGGGAHLYPMEPCPEGTDPPVVSNDTDHHFLVMRVAGDVVDVEARSVDGEAIDRFTVTP